MWLPAPRGDGPDLVLRSEVLRVPTAQILVAGRD